MADEVKTEEVTKKTRTVRTQDERIAALDAKIKYHKDCIASIEAKKKEILEPKKRTRKITSTSGLMKKATEKGMTLEEMAKKLGIEL